MTGIHLILPFDSFPLEYVILPRGSSRTFEHSSISAGFWRYTVETRTWLFELPFTV